MFFSIYSNRITCAQVARGTGRAKLRTIFFARNFVFLRLLLIAFDGNGEISGILLIEK